MINGIDILLLLSILEKNQTILLLNDIVSIVHWEIIDPPKATETRKYFSFC